MPATTTAATSGGGIFIFGSPEVLTGTHTLTLLTPAGYTPTSPTVLTVNKQAGVESSDNNFGLQAQATATATALPATISGYVYHDLNSNGVRDVGEPGVAGVGVSITGPVTRGASSGSPDGFYVFTTVPDGIYTLQINWAAAGYQATSADTLIALVSGGVGVENRNFGGVPAPTPTPTNTATPTPTNTPTSTPRATRTPKPTSEPEATSIPATNTPIPTATSVTGAGVSLAVDPYQGAVGEAFSFVGSGFSENEAISIGLAQPDGSVVGLPAQQANSAGSFAFSFTTKQGDQVGLYTMITEGQTSKRRASGAFIGDDAPTPTPVTVIISGKPDGSFSGAIVPGATPTATPDPLLSNDDPLLVNLVIVKLDDGTTGVIVSEIGEQIPGKGGRK